MLDNKQLIVLQNCVLNLLDIFTHIVYIYTTMTTE